MSNEKLRKRKKRNLKQNSGVKNEVKFPLVMTAF
jgi:hypothetical protein